MKYPFTRQQVLQEDGQRTAEAAISAGASIVPGNLLNSEAARRAILLDRILEIAAAMRISEFRASVVAEKVLGVKLL